MASIVLSGVTAAIGGMVAGPFGAKFGYALGSIASSAMQPGQNYEVSGSRLADVSVQTSTYGKSIPILFGQSRFAGNVIWSLPIKEHENRSEISGGGKGGGGRRSRVTNIHYTYSATLAIGICEGVIDSIINIWADAKNITNEIDNFRIYVGDESQLPDSIIESYLGVGKTPAYRGLAYIVIEDFPLGDYGNRIPNFTFEVKRKAKSKTNIEEIPVEDRLKAISIIPGSGEFVYDTHVQYKINKDNACAQNGKAKPINMNNLHKKADSLVSLDQLQNTCKNIEWVSPVVGWFTGSLNLSECMVSPGVEFKENLHTTPDEWKVAGKTRKDAHQITLKNGSPIYGGTTSDDSILRYLEELNRRGLKIMFYPMLFVDKLDKPWRGHICGNAEDVERFFNKKGGYNHFILHYARLVKGKVDAFLIGSEFKKITSIRDKDGSYPAVRCFIDLARQVKEILGNDVQVSYAADWSEYHHDDKGYYHMDDLWSSKYIDFVGIDAYFPITENSNEFLNEEEVIDGWDSGELYDYYYEGDKKIDLSPKYALKNIEYWWSNYHFNPGNNKTKWSPKSKKVWFTEFGFPSVDGCTNQPNVFFDPEAFDGGLPKNSKGTIDFHSQRVAINATLKKWEGSDIVENLFLWTWDARPYPSWPSLSSVWGDGLKWDKGHWVNGKFGLSLLGDILYELCKRVGIDESQLDISKIVDVVDGFVLDELTQAQDIINLLAKFYFFDAVETDGKLKFVSSKYIDIYKIDSADLIYHSNKNLMQITRHEERLMPQKLEVIYSDREKSYNQNVSRTENYHTSSNKHSLVSSNIVLSSQLASSKSQSMLQNAWNSRHLYKVMLPFQYIFLKPGDVISIEYNNELHNIKIVSFSVVNNRCLEIEGTSYISGVYDHNYIPARINLSSEMPEECKYVSYILDIPARMGSFKDSHNVYIAIASSIGRFKPASLYISKGDDFSHVADIIEESTIGNVHEMLGEASPSIFDFENSLTVSLISGKLESTSEEKILSGANMAMIGDEIVQFTNAELLSENLYKISGFLRGRMGTEIFVGSHKKGDRFILLDHKVLEVEIPITLLGATNKYSFVSDGEKLEGADQTEFTWYGNILKPLSPVHLSYEHSDTEVKISWFRRTRIGGTLRNNVEALLGEEKELYEVEYSSGDEVISTVKTDSPYATCSRNFFDKLSKIRVYQISSVIGRGFAAELHLEK